MKDRFDDHWFKEAISRVAANRRSECADCNKELWSYYVCWTHNDCYNVIRCGDCWDKHRNEEAKAHGDSATRTD